MASLGYMGKGNLLKAAEYAKMGLELEKCHIGLNEILREVRENL